MFLRKQVGSLHEGFRRLCPPAELKLFRSEHFGDPLECCIRRFFNAEIEFFGRHLIGKICESCIRTVLDAENSLILREQFDCEFQGITGVSLDTVIELFIRAQVRTVFKSCPRNESDAEIKLFQVKIRGVIYYNVYIIALFDKFIEFRWVHGHSVLSSPMMVPV